MSLCGYASRAERDIHNYKPPSSASLIMTSEKKILVGIDRCLSSRVIRYLAPSKFRARIEIEARSPYDRNHSRKMYNKFLSFFFFVSSPRTQSDSFFQSTHFRKTLIYKTRLNTLFFIYPTRSPLYIIDLSSSLSLFFTITSLEHSKNHEKRIEIKLSIFFFFFYTPKRYLHPLRTGGPPVTKPSIAIY